MIARSGRTGALHPDVDGEQRPLEAVHSIFVMLGAVVKSFESNNVEMIAEINVQPTQVLESRCD